MGKTDNKRKKRTQRDYNLGFKLAVVEQVEKGEMTYRQAQAAYGIQGKSTVLVWLRKHGSLDWSRPLIYAMQMPKTKETPAQKIKRLEKELSDERLKNEILNRKLSDERLKNEILNRMIELSDQQYGTGVRKKYLSGLYESFRLKRK